VLRSGSGGRREAKRAGMRKSGPAREATALDKVVPPQNGVAAPRAAPSAGRVRIATLPSKSTAGTGAGAGTAESTTTRQQSVSSTHASHTPAVALPRASKSLGPGSGVRKLSLASANATSIEPRSPRHAVGSQRTLATEHDPTKKPLGSLSWQARMRTLVQVRDSLLDAGRSCAFLDSRIEKLCAENRISVEDAMRSIHSADDASDRVTHNEKARPTTALTSRLSIANADVSLSRSKEMGSAARAVLSKTTGDSRESVSGEHVAASDTGSRIRVASLMDAHDTPLLASGVSASASFSSCIGEVPQKESSQAPGDFVVRRRLDSVRRMIESGSNGPVGAVDAAPSSSKASAGAKFLPAATISKKSLGRTSSGKVPAANVETGLDASRADRISNSAELPEQNSSESHSVPLDAGRLSGLSRFGSINALADRGSPETQERRLQRRKARLEMLTGNARSDSMSAVPSSSSAIMAARAAKRAALI